MNRLDTHPIADDPDEVRAFSVVRNERARLPYFLKYHRDLGVKRFFFADNNSTDGTREFLLQQPDCHVFLAAGSYLAANVGMDWLHEMLDAHGTGHWCLTLDADELLIYPNCETVPLAKFRDFLESEGAEGVFTFMLDMYPQGEIKDAVLSPEKTFFEVTPYFDKEYRFVPRISLNGKKSFPPLEVLGGPRSRCFYNETADASYLWRFVVHLLARVSLQIKKFLPTAQINLKPPALFKVPFVKWKAGNRYTASTHTMNEISLSEVTGVLAHFKFFSDFHARVKDAIETGQHTDGSKEYKNYWKSITSPKKKMMYYEGSVEYKSSGALSSLKLIKTSKEFERFVKQELSTI